MERNTYCKRICHEPILIIAFPIFLLFLALYVPMWLYCEHKKKKEGDSFQSQNVSVEVEFGFLLLGILFFPISLILVIVFIVTDALIDIGLWICKKTIKKDFSSRFPRVLEPQVA